MCLKWPFQGLSDLHLGDQKVTGKKLDSMLRLVQNSRCVKFWGNMSYAFSRRSWLAKGHEIWMAGTGWETALKIKFFWHNRGPTNCPYQTYRLNEALSRDRGGQYAPTIPDYTLLAMQPFDHGAWGNYEVHGPSQHHQTLRNLRRSKTYLFGRLAKQWYHLEPECYEMVVSGDMRVISWNCLDFRRCGRLVQ